MTLLAPHQPSSATCLIFGDQGGKFGGGAWMLAVNKQTGNLVWKTQVESVGTFPVITQSAVVDGFLPLSPTWESLPSKRLFEAFIPGYVCCTFRGSMLALNANTGQILWKTYTIPAGGTRGDSYTGGSVWASTPAIDHSRNAVYIGTGNNYSMPIECPELCSSGQSIRQRQRRAFLPMTILTR